MRLSTTLLEARRQTDFYVMSKVGNWSICNLPRISLIMPKLASGTPDFDACARG